MESKERHKKYLEEQREKIRFKYLPESEKKKLTERGLNPFMSKRLREEMRAEYEKERVAWFDNLPVEARKALKRFGWDPRDKDKIITRVGGSFRTK